ncbi:1-phosphofructokinase family hexose kinase [Cohnella xylanilytica]|uniref:Tagatose-6-phosphate kinase n=1 Tax=Cohnella xylanilytica TaxID=557555 RepID=A0A841U1Z8_9BACL|nr:1-phosphofructokinase family hexose kinase [Cohnella xylanilytica]MBB6694566.1 1-phosphofructokinase family hexose kinase [Cohnella xylanilytica]
MLEGSGFPAASASSLPIVCGALNPAIDKRLHVERLRLGEVHRVTRLEATAGGKGLNVARVARSLGAPVLAAGFAGGTNGDWLRGRLEAAGIGQRWIAIEGETRICLNLIDDADGTSTEVLEPGPEITASEAEAFADAWRELCETGRWMTLSGSLPRGLSDDYYARLIGMARERGAHVVLDTSGNALKLGVQAGPHAVKPNEDEFRQWTGADPRDERAVRLFAAELGRFGVRTLIVSLGRDGCIAATPEGELWRAIPPAIQAANAVGSGDSFVAGWTVARSRGLAVPDALRLATAAGAANAMSPGTGAVDPVDAAELAGRVRIST